MAERLARLFGTEEDKVNCSFFFKIGACRHGDKCTRLHYKPQISQTLLIPHMYENPPIALAIAEGAQVPEEQAKEATRHFEDFYEEVFLELANYGEMEDFIICDNIGDHLVGNVYVKYVNEEDAAACMKNLTGRYYAGKIIVPEYSPVTDFREARCRQYDEGVCSRGGYCNFMHLKHISRSFKRSLFKQMYDDHPEFKKKKKDNNRDKKGKRSRSRSHKRKRSSKEKKRRGERGDSQHSSPSRPRDMSSQERRAMIEQWNQEEEKQEAAQFQQGHHPDMNHPPMYDQAGYGQYPPQGGMMMGAGQVPNMGQPQYNQQFFYNEERAKPSHH